MRYRKKPIVIEAIQFNSVDDYKLMVKTWSCQYIISIVDINTIYVKTIRG